MKQNNSSTDTIKRIILVVISVCFGTFASNILGNIDMNIWFTRVIGALTTTVVALLLYPLLIKNTKK